MRLRWRGIACLVALVLVAVAIAVSVLVYFQSLPFSPAAWADPARIERGEREVMARRLVREETLVGKTRAEVAALLGQPEPSADTTSSEYFLRVDMLNSDGIWLVLEYGSDNRVARAWIRPN